jgi:ribonuclease HI
LVHISIRMIEVYTDGSCLGNPGPGGWAYLIDTLKGQGGAKITTNNVMEMTAVVHALEKCIELKYTSVCVFTDSNYVRTGLLEWSKNWERNGWKTSKGEPVKNKELWIRMLDLKKQFGSIEFKWVKAHNGNEKNEQVDTLARDIAYLFSKKE